MIDPSRCFFVDEEINSAIESGKLQTRVGKNFGKPYKKLIRHEVESLVKELKGEAGIESGKVQKELNEVS